VRNKLRLRQFLSRVIAWVAVLLAYRGAAQGILRQ